MTLPYKGRALNSNLPLFTADKCPDRFGRGIACYFHNPLGYLPSSVMARMAAITRGLSAA